jgi:class 3 adenylate cyclase/tetratricopeptide (TPR) repeat protein
VYTPKHLAERILTSRSALEGERKQVTVLFADVKGSTELAAGLDPEALHRIMDSFFAILADGVHRFEGTINQYTGDGVMALFGAPIAHEDHAHRACYAALHLRQELRRYADQLRLAEGVNFSVRIGLNSGEVVVGKIGDDLRMDYTAQGHTVNLAARMEQIAEPGRVYLTEHVAALVPGFFTMRDLGPLEVKGAAAPVRVYELEGVGALRTRLDLSRARGLSSFVGRQAETAVLDRAIARVQGQEGQIVGVVGEAGVGKSRLCYEFIQQCRTRHIKVYEAQAAAHARTVPFLMILQMLRAYFGVTEGDVDEDARRKITGTVVRLDSALTDALPELFDFLGVPDPAHPAAVMDSETRQAHLLTIVSRVLQAGSTAEPAVFVFEDLHWIDGGSETFLERWAEAIPETGILLLLNYRPEYQPPWVQRPGYQQLPLAPLGRAAITELLRALLGTDASVGRLAEQISDRTGGNPFFTEEAVRSLIEAGVLQGGRGAYRLTRSVDEVLIPPTVQAVLAARIDRLAEREKAVLQTASVIGREFCGRILDRVAGLGADELGQAVRQLMTSEFVHETELYPHPEYAFKHPLTQEVAYRSQLGDQRTQVHAAVARACEDIYRDKVDERAALLAHHWEQAGEVLKAAHWHRRAAERVGLNDNAAALEHWQAVRRLVARLDDSADAEALRLVACVNVMQILPRSAAAEDARGYVAVEERATIFAEGVAVAERTGAATSLARLHASHAMLRMQAGAFDEASRHAAEAIRIVERSGDPGPMLGVVGRVIMLHEWTGRVREAQRLAEQALARVGNDHTLRASDEYTRLLISSASILGTMGRLDEATDVLERAGSLAREHCQVESQGSALSQRGLIELHRGEVQSALRYLGDAIAIGEKVGSVAVFGPAYTILGMAYVADERWDDAVDVLEIIRERAHLGGRVAFDPVILACLAEAHCGRGDVDRAMAMVEEAVALGARLGTWTYECLGQTIRARMLLRTQGIGARDVIEAALTRALDLCQRSGASVYEPRIHIGRGELARLAGDWETAERELREAHRLLTEMGAPGAERQLVEHLKEVVARQGGSTADER